MAVTSRAPRTARRLGRDPRAGAVLGAVTIAFSGIFVRLSHASPSTAAVFRCAFALPVLLALAAREDRALGRRDLRARASSLLAGVFFTGDLILWNASIGDVGAGLATVLANIQVLIIPLVAWVLLDERPSRAQLLALPLAALGVLLISGVVEHGAYGAHPERGTLLGVGAGVAYVGFLLLLRHGSSDTRRVAGPLCDATLVAVLGSLAVGATIGDLHLAPVWPGWGWLLVLALSSQVMGWMLIGSSLPRLPAALGSILLTIQPVGSVLFAAIILHESPSALQLAGVALVVAGLLSVRGAPRPARRPPAPGRAV
ncbi:MAG TPA: DMT family transporter [Solirubrobacteraceae bacterium]|nr:DMT family transporter [Solirubrobacteraceae bacterium]